MGVIKTFAAVHQNDVLGASSSLDHTFKIPDQLKPYRINSVLIDVTHLDNGFNYVHKYNYVKLGVIFTASREDLIPLFTPCPIVAGGANGNGIFLRLNHQGQYAIYTNYIQGAVNCLLRVTNQTVLPTQDTESAVYITIEVQED